MYIDFIKNKYPDIPDIDRQAYIDRDKKALISIVQEKIAQNAEEIVERWYKLSDIGFLPQEEKFLDLLKEAEQLYSFGFYTGTIAVVGIACEEYCRYLVAKHKLADVNTQEKRIDKLYQDGVITSDIKDALHTVRKLRNDCMHYNISFKQLDENELEQHAFDMIVQYKACLHPLAIKVDDRSEEDLIADFVKAKKSNLREYLYKHRNILHQTKDINLQISPNVENMIFVSVYYIGEIDISEHFHEMTLIDLNNPYPVVVDLTLPQCEMIKNLKLKEGNLITATLTSAVSSIGQTEECVVLRGALQVHITFPETVRPGRAGHPQKRLVLGLIAGSGPPDDLLVDLKIVAIKGGVLPHELFQRGQNIHILKPVHGVTPPIPVLSPAAAVSSAVPPWRL